MTFQEFVKLYDHELTNRTIVEHVVVAGAISLGPLTPGLQFNEIRAWPLDWREDAEDGSRITFASDCADSIRLQQLNVERDDEGIVRYVQWTLNLNVPPGSPQLAGPEPDLAAAFGNSLGKPKKSSKAGKKWVSADTSLMLSDGRGTDFEGFVVVGVLYEPFRERALLDPRFRKL